MKLGEVFYASHDDALVGMAFMKPDTNILTADEVVYEFLGQNFSVNLIDFIHEDDKQAFLAFVENCEEKPSQLTAKCACAKGGWRDISFVISKVRFYRGQFIRIDMFDVEYMSHNYKKFTAAENFLQSYEKASNDIMFIYNLGRDKMRISRGGEILFSGTMEQWKERFVSRKLVAGGFLETAMGICTAIEQANGSGSQLIESCIFDKNGDYKPVFVNYGAVEYNSFPFYTVGTISDTVFPDRSKYDPLTGIYNKREIGRLSGLALTEAIKKGQIIVFIFIDLDHFKEVNDTYGHLAGDRALINAARIIKGVIGDKGVVGRMGGDEFFAFMPDFKGDHETLRGVLRSIREHIRRHFLDCGQKVTCSIGAASYPKDSANYDELFKLADFCMYLAKTKGRNRFVIYKSSAHGTPAEIVGNGMQFNGYLTEEEKSEHLLDVISRANAAQELEFAPLLRTFMGEIKQLYGISAVQYCPAEDNGRYAEVSDYRITQPRAFMDIYYTYKNRIEERGYIALGNYMNARSFLPEIAYYMEKNGLCSLFIAPCFTEDGVFTGIFVLTSKVQYSWSEFDVDTLLALCGVMDRFV